MPRIPSLPRRVAVRAALGTLAALLGVAVPATPAWAPPPPTVPGVTGDAGALPDGPGVYAAYRETIQIVETPDRTATRRPTHWCAFWAAPLGNFGDIEDYLDDRSNIVPRRGDPQSGFVIRQCFERGSVEAYARDVLPWVPPTRRPAVPDLPPDVVTLETVEAYAMARLPLAAPPLASSPPAARLLTGVETWFVVERPAPVTVTAQVGQFWATATATATAVALDLGDGTTLACPVAATAAHREVRPDCLRHTYLDSRVAPAGRLTVRATFTYTVTMTTHRDEVPTQVDPASGPPAATPVVVRQAQAVGR